MKQLLVQEFLEKHSFKELQDNHGIYASLSKNKKKVSINYDMIETKDDDILSWDCRGLILCKDDYSEFKSSNDKLNLNVIVGNTRIISFPMKRFFNYSQGSAYVNWNDPKLQILEKLDGSLLIVGFCPISKSWFAATRAVPEADLLMDNQLHSFRTLFEKALKETCNLDFKDYTDRLDKDITYCFELTTPLNRIVVDYKNYGVTLLATRSLISLKELDISLIPSFGVPKVKAYSYSSIPELLDWVSSLDPSEHEGIVVKDSNFNRIKMKNPAYVAASKLRDRLGTSIRNCLEIILLGKEDDAISFLPQEIADNLLSIKEKYRVWLTKEEQMYLKVFSEAANIKPNDKKTFALTINNFDSKLFNAAYFNIFDNKSTSIKDFIDKNRKDGSWSNSFIDKILSFI